MNRRAEGTRVPWWHIGERSTTVMVGNAHPTRLEKPKRRGVEFVVPPLGGSTLPSPGGIPAKAGTTNFVTKSAGPKFVTILPLSKDKKSKGDAAYLLSDCAHEPLTPSPTVLD